MSRRKEAKKREVTPEPKFGDVKVAKFIQIIMHHGKKSLAERIVYGAMDRLSVMRKGADPLESFHECLDKLRPLVEVRSRRVGGATYQIPVEVRPNRSLTLSMRWLVSSARERSGNEKDMGSRLAAEMVDVLEGRGGAMKKRESAHKMAEANQAFSHYRW